MIILDKKLKQEIEMEINKKKLRRCMWEGCDKVLGSHNKSGLCHFHWRKNYDANAKFKKLQQKIKNANKNTL